MQVGQRQHALDSFDPKSMKLEGKIALVTGADTGIGRFTALHLARAGATVLIHGRSAERIAQVLDEIRSAGGKAEPLFADLASLATHREP